MELNDTRDLLTVTEYREWSSFEKLTPELNRLLAENHALGIFSTIEWLGAWWHAYGSGKKLLALSFVDRHGEVVGLAPLYVERRRKSILRPRVLRFVGDGSEDSDDLDLLVRPGNEDAVVHAFLQWLQTAPCDICQLNCISPRSTILGALRNELQRGGWKQACHGQPSLTLYLPSSWEQYLKQLSGKERGKIGNLTRRLESHYQLRFCKCETLEELPKCLDILFLLHQQRWEPRGEPGSFSVMERRNFYQAMARILLSRGWLELWFLELDGQPVAAQIALRYHETVYALQEGFDPRYANQSVGYVLRAHVLRQCVAAGIERYEFLAGDQESKQRWGAEAGNYTDIHFARPGTMGLLHLLGEEYARGAKTYVRGVKAWLLSQLPENAVRRLRGLRLRWKKTRHDVRVGHSSADGTGTGEPIDIVTSTHDPVK